MNLLLPTTLYVLSLTYLLQAQPTPNYTCGVPRIRHQALLRFGSDSSPGDWPWHAALYHRTGRSVEYACGGTLISEEFVVTAAHCLYDPETGVQLTKRRIRVRLGLHNLDKISSDAVKEFGVEEFYVPDRFQRESLRDDIALLELNEAVRYTDYILPACINGQVLTSADSGTAIGWGVTEDDTISPVLKEARMPVIDTAECLDSDRDFFASMIHRCMFCAGFRNGTTVCNGDSGGGLFVERNGVWHLGGIVSFSKARGPGSNLCVTDGYAGFTEVARFVEWIQSVSDVKAKRPRISERKCLEYRQTLRDPHQFVPAITRDLGYPLKACHATIISEQFLLTTAKCAVSDGQLVRIKGPDYDISDNSTTIVLLTSSKLALIKLGKSYAELKPDITCLWTDPTRIAKDQLSDGHTPDVPMRYWSYLNSVEDDEAGTVTVPGDTLSCRGRTDGVGLFVKRTSETFYRLVGLLDSCEPSKYGRVTPFLNEIERNVWPGES